ncbi:MAG: gatA, partial [Solirubrobacteraceae bacterium]|nr:gatA [Solirubrobacteraceae bacterium]
GLAPWALGTDTGGSIRQPAALCGIVGMKPTYGTVSRYGMIAFASSLDQAGPLTRDVTDCALLFSHMTGADPRDSTSLAFPGEATMPSAERLDGVRYGLRVESDDLISMYTNTRHDGFGAEVKRRILIGTYALSSGYYDAYYGRAQQVRTKIADDFREAFERFDFVVTPTSPGVAFELGAKTADPLSMYLNDYCTVPMPLAGIPAISIPSGLSEGLPVGFQLAGPAFSEYRMMDAAYALEQAIGFDGSGPRT